MKSGDRVLDVGCGVGGPLRNISRFTGAHVTGLNNNGYQVKRAIKLNETAKLQKQTDVVQGEDRSEAANEQRGDGQSAACATV